MTDSVSKAPEKSRFLQNCLVAIFDARDAGLKQCQVSYEQNDTDHLDRDIMEIFKRGYTIKLLHGQQKVAINWNN